MYLGVIRLVKSEKTKAVLVVPEKIKAAKDVEEKFYSDMPTCIRGVLNEFKDVFPANLPPRLTSVQKGHEFRIDLEDTTAPVHKPIHKLSPLEHSPLEHGSRLTTCSSTDISHHWIHPMDPQSYLCRKRMEASSFV